MRNPIAESLLEMVYFAPLLKHFRAVLGEENLRILKPTPQREVFIGFDLGFATSDLVEDAVETSVRKFIQQNVNSFSHFRAFFLQFKPVEEHRNLRGALSGWKKPWYSVNLSTKKNSKTKMSQHETLVKLSTLPNTFVAYACPMIFTFEEIALGPDLTSLRQIDVVSAPKGWLTDETHRIVFEDRQSQAYWKSDPLEATHLHLTEAILKLKVMDRDQFKNFVSTVRKVAWANTDKLGPGRPLPESMIVLAS